MEQPGAVGAPAAGSTGHLLLADDFADPLRPGRVIGSTVAGHRRGGRDVEDRLGVDGGALRIAPLRTPGWGRCSLAYGPFPPDAGLAAVVHVSNGHHASESYGIRSMRSQMLSWLRGSHTRALARRGPRAAHRPAPAPGAPAAGRVDPALASTTRRAVGRQPRSGVLRHPGTGVGFGPDRRLPRPRHRGRQRCAHRPCRGRPGDGRGTGDQHPAAPRRRRSGKTRSPTSPALWRARTAPGRTR